MLSKSDYLAGPARSKVPENVLSKWLLHHPYITIGLCIFIGLVVLLYFVVVVPLCGVAFQQTDAEGKRVCWFADS